MDTEHEYAVKVFKEADAYLQTALPDVPYAKRMQILEHLSNQFLKLVRHEVREQLYRFTEVM